jgi:hypothetical protein
MPKTRRVMTLPPDRAAQAVSILIHEGKLKLLDLTRALERREKMVNDLRAKLAAFGEGSGNGRRRGRRQKAKPRKFTKRISKRQRAARQAQGRYLGAIRRLPAKSRAKVKTIREKSGVRAAIAAAKKMEARRTSSSRRRQPTTAGKKRPGKGPPQKPQKARKSPASRREAHASAPTTT